MLKGRIEILQYEISRYKKEKEKILNQKTKNSYNNFISKLTKEISNYKTTANNYKNNCKELSKEILSLRSKISKYENN